MMAAGRGQFFRSFLGGSERQPAQPAPGRRPPALGGGKPGPSGGKPSPSPGQRRAGGGGKKARPKAAPSPVTRSERSFAEARTEKRRTEFPRNKASSTKESFVERLPPEILTKILSYLDTTSLICISHVSILFHRLASDDFMWHKIYMSEFGGQLWKPKSADDTAVVKEAPVVAGDWSPGRWKRTYLRTVASKWRRELRDISPYTGLPRQTKWVLRNLNVSWELTLCDCWGQESTLELSRAYYFESSVVVRWSGGYVISYRHISSIKLHGVRKEMVRGSKARSPYSEPADPPPLCTSDPKFGLHSYTLHFVLHNTGTEIISGHFRQLSCRTVQIQHGLVELKIINRTNLSQHRSLSGAVKLPWKSEALEGSVENCCIMTLTLLDEFQKPFLCVSSPIHITAARSPLSFDYSGEHFLVEYQNLDGQVEMMLVWLREQKEFFLISLTVSVSIFKVNKHFSRDY